MIVVIGSPLHLPGSEDRPSGAGGAAVAVAAAAAELDHEVQLVGRVGEDRAGDATLLALARLGIGHVAMLRDAARPTPVMDTELDEAAIVGPTADDPDVASADAGAANAGAGDAPAGSEAFPTLDRGDVELALRYLVNPAVIVVAEPLDDDALEVVADAAAYAGAGLIVLVGEGGAAPAATGLDRAIVLGAPADDPDGVFGRTVGAVAAAIDGGADPGAALEAVVAASDWEPAES